MAKATSNCKSMSNEHQDDPDSSLMQIIHDRVKVKDFCNEIRAVMDVEEFVHQGQVLMRQRAAIGETLTENLIEHLLHQSKIGFDTSSRDESVQEAKSALFVPGTTNLLSQVIKQGTISSNDLKLGNDFDCQTTNTEDSSGGFELSWLITYGSLHGINRRHMILVQYTRDGAPKYLDKQINLLMIILAPSAEKETKSAFEAARTFATLFNSMKLDQQLLLMEAKTETLLMASLMIKAKQLFEDETKRTLFANRHKYSFSPSVSIHIEKSNRPKTKSDILKTMYEMNLALSESKLNDSNGLPCFVETRASVALTHALDLSAKKNHDRTMIANGQLDGQKQIDSMSAGNDDGDLAINFGSFGRGIYRDLTRRLKYYPSDFKDAFVGPKRTTQKTISTIWWLYFGILLPIIAFNLLNYNQTNGHLGDLRKSIIGQAIGGLVFALFGGQPLVIIMTTAPLCLYTKVIFSMCQGYGFDFTSMYALVGIWNCVFLIIYSLFNFSKLMKWCTRSTEEIFAMFIVVAFITDAFKNMMKNFNRFYFSPACEDLPWGLADPEKAERFGPNGDHTYAQFIDEPCQRDSSVLFLFLMLATVWLATILYRFHKTPYFSYMIRLFLSDYALPISVVLVSFLGSYVFDRVRVEESPASSTELIFTMANLSQTTLAGHLLAIGLGFTLSILFFMDQNISAAMVMAPQNNLKKGTAYHYDLLIVGLLNAVLTLFGLPMMHGVLPHSPLHVRNLADIEEKVENGHKVERITNVRETRVTALVAHLLMLATIHLIPYPIEYIPRAVLNGLFLYMAITSLDGLRIFDRILLIFTQQSEYPPSHYIRACPQRIVHLFTCLQLVQLAVMCFFGFSPINAIEMFFPVVILLMMLFRHRIVPKYIDEKYLETLDGKHCS